MAAGCRSPGSWDPWPVRPGQVVIVEVDRLEGTDPLPVEVMAKWTEETDGNTVWKQGTISLRRTFEKAGLDLRVVHDDFDLPNLREVRLDQLHRLMKKKKTVLPGPGEWHIHLIVGYQLVDEPQTTGVMFDLGGTEGNALPREACAIFQEPIRDIGGDFDAERLLAAAHEIAHALNIHHLDFEGGDFWNAATIEGYAPADLTDWRLSKASVKHIREHDRELVQPGAGGVPYGVIHDDHADKHREGDRHPDAVEPFIVVRGEALRYQRRDAGDTGPGFEPDDPVHSLRIADLAEVVGPSDVVSESESLSQATAYADRHLRLGIDLVGRDPDGALSIPLGAPVKIRATLEHTDDPPAAEPPMVGVSRGLLRVSVASAEDDPDFRPFQPGVRRSNRGRRPEELAPGASLPPAEVDIFYGARGWTFPKEGSYRVRAVLPVRVGEEMVPVLSNVLNIRIHEPTLEADVEALRILRDDEDDEPALSEQAGLFLLLGGGEHLEEGGSKVRKIREKVPESLCGKAATDAEKRRAAHENEFKAGEAGEQRPEEDEDP